MDPTILATLVTIAAGAAGYGFVQLQKWWGVRVMVHWVTRADSKYLDSAFDLYERRIEETDQDSRSDILRWMNEVQLETKKGTCRLKDFFLLARLGPRVAGALYFHYYPKAKYGFISFVVVDDAFPGARRHDVSRQLLRRMVKLLKKKCRDCRGLVAEVPAEFYQKAKRGKHRERSIKPKIELFKGYAEQLQLRLIELPVAYVQPDLSLEARKEAERPMKLLYLPLTHTPPSKAETVHVLRFVYTDIYGDSFEGTAENDRYRAYINDVFERVVSTIPREAA